MRVRLQSSVEERIAGFIDTYRDLRDRTGRMILPRTEMTMNAVYPFAPSLTIMELRETGDWRIRLSGTEICERSGVNATGRSALASFSAGERAMHERIMCRMFDMPCGIRALISETYVNGTEAVLDTVTLPLTGSEGQRLAVTYSLILRDIEHRYRARPVARRTRLLSYRNVYLAYPALVKEMRLAG